MKKYLIVLCLINSILFAVDFKAVLKQFEQSAANPAAKAENGKDLYSTMSALVPFLSEKAQQEEIVAAVKRHKVELYKHGHLNLLAAGLIKYNVKGLEGFYNDYYLEVVDKRLHQAIDAGKGIGSDVDIPLYIAQMGTVDTKAAFLKAYKRLKPYQADTKGWGKHNTHRGIHGNLVAALCIMGEKPIIDYYTKAIKNDPELELKINRQIFHDRLIAIYAFSFLTSHEGYKLLRAMKAYDKLSNFHFEHAIKRQTELLARAIINNTLNDKKFARSLQFIFSGLTENEKTESVKQAMAILEKGK